MGNKVCSCDLPGNAINTVTIYGDYFDSDTRTLISMLSYSTIPFKLQETRDPEDHVNKVDG